MGADEAERPPSQLKVGLEHLAHARRPVAPLPAVRTGRHVRFVRKHVEDWLSALG